MGDMSDYYLEQELMGYDSLKEELEFVRFHRFCEGRGTNPNVWVTKDRRPILIGELDTSHLKNILNLCRRRVAQIREDECYLLDNLPQYQNLLNELNRRNDNTRPTQIKHR